MPLSDERKRDHLRTIPLFQGLSDGDLLLIAQHAQELEFLAGEIVARESEIGTGLFLILDGKVRIIRHGREVAVRGPGEYVGELSVLHRAPRVANVVAAEPTICLGLASWDVAEVIQQHPRVAVQLLEEAGRRLAALAVEQSP